MLPGHSVLSAICLATLITATACGNGSGDSSGGAAAEVPETAEAPAETPPPPLKARILGTWDMSAGDFIQTAPLDKRGKLLVLHYSFREAAPTEAELDAAGIKGIEAISIGLMREKHTKEPNNPSIVKGRQAYEALAKMAPNLEVTQTELVIVVGSKRMPSTYTITEEQADRLLLRSVDVGDGEVDMLTVTMPDEHSLRLVDNGDQKILNFRRRGAPAAVVVAVEEPDLRSDPRAARLIGRWNAASHGGGVSFAADGVYTIHGAGGDITGRFRVIAINDSELMLRTSIDSMPLASDRIRAVFADDTHVTWTNLGSNSTSQYVKQ